MNKKTKVDSETIESTPKKKKAIHKEATPKEKPAEIENKELVPEGKGSETPETPQASPVTETKPEDNGSSTEVATEGDDKKETISKEKLIDRQLEILWANGRKQLLSEPSHTKHPSNHK